MGLTRDAILRARLRIETVDIPEWGGPLAVRVMTGEERDAYIEARAKAADEKSSVVAAGLIVASACDEDGTLLFTADDIPSLTKLSTVALTQALTKILEVNGIGPGGQERAEKN